MLTLVRYFYSYELTTGILFNDKVYVADTLECPWKDNTPNISCIPEGEYSLSYRDDPSFHVKKCYTVDPVEGRFGILIHAANSVGELKGCIAVGTKTNRSLNRSEEALDRLHTLMPDTGTLKIIGAKDGLLSMRI